MTEVVIVGIGQTKVGEHWELSLRELALQAIENTIMDASGLQPQALYVANKLAPRLSRQAHLGALIADFCGLVGIEAVSIEAAGASGGAALRSGYLAVLSGQVESVMVLGIEKFTDQVGSAVEESLSISLDSDYEAAHGVTQTGQAALLMRRYFYENGIPEFGLGGFPVTAHRNGEGNPNAMFRRAIKSAMYEKAPVVSDPLNMFDVAPTADGAAAVLITRSDLVPEGFPNPLVLIAGSSTVTDTLALHDRHDPLTFTAARESVRRALHQARVEREQVDLFELNDAFSIYTALSLEAAGYAEPGQGWKLAENGSIAIDGEIPVTTMGGLKARGNVGAASGVYQVVEATLQLRGAAGENQVPGARVAMVQCLGGPASTAVTHILMSGLSK
jgi:acetyl-CoA C-acetyltransferase